VHHTDLPFLEDGGTYTLESEAQYTFQNSAGLGQVTLRRVADVTVGPGGQNQTSVSVTTVIVNTEQAHAEARVRRSLGSDEFLEWRGARRVVISFDFRALSDGKATTLWAQPAGLKVQKDGGSPLYVSLLPPFAVFGISDPAALDPETALAVLVGFEAVNRSLDPGPMTLPSRTS
jgi:hypothetical protein